MASACYPILDCCRVITILPGHRPLDPLRYSNCRMELLISISRVLVVCYTIYYCDSYVIRSL